MYPTYMQPRVVNSQWVLLGAKSLLGAIVRITYCARVAVPLIRGVRSAYIGSSVLSGISLGPFVDPSDAAITPLPDDLSVSITYRKKGRIEISWSVVVCVPPFLCGSPPRLERGRELTRLDD